MGDLGAEVLHLGCLGKGGNSGAEGFTGGLVVKNPPVKQETSRFNPWVEKMP